MEDRIKNLLIRELERIISLVKEDKCAMTDQEAMTLISTICHEAMSKEQVLVYLGWSRSKFDDYCAKGLMPRGKKRSGWKELCWFKDEINDAIINLRRKRYD